MSVDVRDNAKIQSELTAYQRFEEYLLSVRNGEEPPICGIHSDTINLADIERRRLGESFETLEQQVQECYRTLFRKHGAAYIREDELPELASLSPDMSLSALTEPMQDLVKLAGGLTSDKDGHVKEIREFLHERDRPLKKERHFVAILAKLGISSALTIQDYGPHSIWIPPCPGVRPGVAATFINPNIIRYSVPIKRS